MVIPYFRWWFTELAGLLPGGGADAAHSGQWLCIDIGEERTEVRLGGARERLLLDLPSREIAELETQLHAIMARLDPRRVQCLVSVPRERVLVREVSLPAAARENLREVLGFEMSRRTPFPADAVYFDYRVQSQDAASQTINVHLEVVPRTLLAPVMGALASWDPQPATAPDPVGNDGGRGRFAFRPAAFRERPHTMLNVLLAVLVLGLAVALVWLPFEEQRAYRESLEQALDAARLEAAEVAALRDQLAAERDARGLISGARQGRPVMVDLLESLTRSLPDGTYLFRLEVDGDEVNLHGSSDGASGLIAILEASPHLEGVRFASPVTRDGATGRERFHIVAGVIAGGER